MLERLLKELKIDPALRGGELLDALEQKNLEYLERINGSNDDARRAQLQATQLQIEAVLLGLRGGMTLQPPATGGQTTASSQPTPTAPKAAVTPAPRAATPAQPPAQPKQQAPAQPQSAAPDPVQRRRALFTAAQGGDGKAALALAGEYQVEGNLESAKKWAMAAHDLRMSGAGQLLLSLCKDKKEYQEVLPLCVQELSWLTGYDQFAMCETLQATAGKKGLSKEWLLSTYKAGLSSLSAGSPGREMMEELCATLQIQVDADREKAAREKTKRETEQKEAKRIQEESMRAAEKEKRERERETAAEKRRARNEKLLPKLSCIFAPPILAFVVHKLFWFVNEKYTKSGDINFAAIILLPLLAGFLCAFGTWKLAGNKYRQGRAIRNSILLSLAANFAALSIFAMISRLFNLEELFPLTVYGSVKITAEGAMAIPTVFAYYYLCFRGAKDDIT